jgi:hypothetical protein
MPRESLPHVEKMKRIFEIVAYGSLGIDMAITAVTLISANSSGHAFLGIQIILNDALSVIFIISALLLVAIVIMEHYEKIIDRFAQAAYGTRGKRRRRKGQTKLHHHAMTSK